MFERKRVRIGQFLKERDGRYDPKDKSVLGLKRLNKIDFSGEIHLSDKGSKTDMIVVEPGDFVISGINVSKGTLAVYHGEKPITATIHYSSYIFDEKQIDTEYFKRFVRSQFFIQALKDQVKGGIKTEIKPKHFLPLEIDLPDIEIQKDTVSFFKRVEGDMDKLGSEISSQIKYLNKFRQAVFQETIEGKLTAGWRKQNPHLISGENHAAKLLEKIRAEKDRLIKEGKICKEKPLPPITDDEKPFVLPDGWVWCRLGDICDFITKGTTPPTHELKSEGDVPYLKVYNIVNQKINFFYRPQYISPEVHERLKRSKVYPGDILMNIVGPPLGKVAIVPDSFTEWNINQALAIFRPVLDGVGEFLYMYLLAGFEIKKIHTLGVVGQDNISLVQCRNIIFPLMPPAEQKEALRRVSELSVVVDELEKQVFDRKKQSELLMQSVMREAFEN